MGLPEDIEDHVPEVPEVPINVPQVPEVPQVPKNMFHKYLKCHKFLPSQISLANYWYYIIVARSCDLASGLPEEFLMLRDGNDSLTQF